MRLPEDSAGKKIKCSGCEAIHRITEADDGSLSLLSLEPAAQPEAEMAACSECSAMLRSGSEFCAECGAQLGDTKRATASNKTRRVRGAGRRATASNKRSVNKAGLVMLILSALFVLSGTYEGMNAQEVANRSILTELNNYSDEATYPWLLDIGEGRDRYTAGEIREILQGEIFLIYAISYFLAALMLGLFFWSRKSPLPAITTALCVYLGLELLSAILDPSGIARGIVIKVIIVLALLTGLQSALAQRNAQRRAARLEEAR